MPACLRYFLAFAYFATAAAFAQHTLSVAYNTSPSGGDVSLHPFGAFSLTFDSFPIIKAGWPFASSFFFSNGSQPDWNMMRTPLNRTFTRSAATYLASYRWGSLMVKHLPSPALALDMEVTVSNALPVGITTGSFGVHADLAYWSPNGTEMMFPHPLTGFGFACEGCWPPNCGDSAQCSPSAPQAIPIDFQSGAAAWVLLDAPAPLPRPIAPSDAPWLTVGVHSPDKLVAGSRYTLLAALAGVLPSQAAITARFTLRFGDGTGLAPQPKNPEGPLALVADVFSAFGRARPMTAPLLPGGPIGALFGANCGASCNCKSDGMGPGPAACSGILFWSIEGSECEAFRPPCVNACFFHGKGLCLCLLLSTPLPPTHARTHAHTHVHTPTPQISSPIPFTLAPLTCFPYWPQKWMPLRMSW